MREKKHAQSIIELLQYYMCVNQAKRIIYRLKKQ